MLQTLRKGLGDRKNGVKRIFVPKAHFNIDLSLKCIRKNFMSHYLGFEMLVSSDILKQQSSVNFTQIHIHEKILLRSKAYHSFSYLHYIIQ